MTSSLVGKTIGKYQLTGLLGAGGMAQVYRGVQMPLERDVAVKVLHAHLTEQGDLRERFLREAKAVASLRHPNIVQMYDYDFDAGICYMAMEFLDGASLEDRLLSSPGADPEAGGEHDPLSAEEALEIVIEVTKALNFAHNQGIVHRDIKPANIMQTAGGRIVLTDFGIATILHETRLTVEGGTSGTPSYMSPEQALGERGDERSDIYSLGAVLYQLVTGRLPFEADTLYGLIMMHVNETPPPATHFNPLLKTPVEQIIQKAMAKEPDDRYQSAGELGADLQAVLDDKPISVKVPTAANHTFANVLSAYKLQIGIGAMVVALLSFGGWVLLAPGEAPPEPPLAADGVGSMAAAPPPNQAYLETFDDNHAGWLLTDSPISRQVVGGVYEILVEMPGRAIAAYPKMLGDYSRFSYSADAVLVDGQPESGYGLVFHRQDDENYYVFAVNGLRQWSVWRLQDGTWRELRNLPDDQTWTASEAVLPPGQVNQLQLETDESTFNLFVNNKHLLKLSDDQTPLTGGGIGFYVASSRTADDAVAHIQFDNVALAPLNDLTIPSMASDK